MGLGSGLDYAANLLSLRSDCAGVTVTMRARPLAQLVGSGSRVVREQAVAERLRVWSLPCQGTAHRYHSYSRPQTEHCNGRLDAKSRIAGTRNPPQKNSSQ